VEEASALGQEVGYGSNGFIGAIAAGGNVVDATVSSHYACVFTGGALLQWPSIQRLAHTLRDFILRPRDLFLLRYSPPGVPGNRAQSNRRQRDSAEAETSD
jgi:hypothetical protein